MNTQELLHEEVVGFRVVGKHVYGNLIECINEDLLSDAEELKRIVIEAAETGNMTLLDVKAWEIGLGVSVVAIILESHITVHTWPEYRYATVDVYSCGRHTDSQKAFEYIISALKPRRVEIGKASRSLE
ncbi:MAG: adenosylmethionine decarboxylase [Desulfurococcales archaeon]|nr:adenosylmethionine decarboxylase [Desulfurococcales archaeon]